MDLASNEVSDIFTHVSQEENTSQASHAMRNAVVEELSVDREAKVMQKQRWSP
jgi:hypothetical protein